MGSFAPVLHKIYKVTDYGDPISHIAGGQADLGYDVFKPKTAPAVNAPPNVSTAANLAQQQNDLRQRQRGVLSNIFAGGNQNSPAPATSSGGVLGG